jgi:hypothetical protein
MLLRYSSKRSEISRGYRVIVPLLALIMVFSVMCLTACSGDNNETTTGTTSAAVEESKANITGNLVAVRVSKGDYPWELDVKIASVGDFMGYDNPVKGTEGQTITAKTQKYMLGYTIGQGVNMVITQETGADGTYLVASEIAG